MAAGSEKPHDFEQVLKSADRARVKRVVAFLHTYAYTLHTFTAALVERVGIKDNAVLAPTELPSIADAIKYAMCVEFSREAMLARFRDSYFSSFDAGEKEIDCELFERIAEHLWPVDSMRPQVDLGVFSK